MTSAEPDQRGGSPADGDRIGIALVTPAFNAGRYIDETIASVRAQRYDPLEYIVIDGGSTDGTVDQIRAHESWVTAWLSEPDGGMYDAINKGFAKTTAEVMGWINADDVLLPGALATVGAVFAAFPELEWVSTRTPIAIDGDGAIVKLARHPAFSRRGFHLGDHTPAAAGRLGCYLQQEGTFWRRSLWDRAGGSLDASCKVAGDFDLWCRFAREAELVSIDVPLGAFRYHAGQASDMHMDRYLAEADEAYRSAGHRRPGVLHRAGLAVKRCCSDAVTHRLMRAGVLRSSPRLTYDWASRSWVMEGGTLKRGGGG